MPRSGAGTYNPPGTYPPTPGSLISLDDYKALVNDIVSEITDSLSRSGKGGMLAAVRGVDGTQSAPAFSFTSDPDTGLARLPGELLAVVDAVVIAKLAAAGFTINANTLLAKGGEQSVLKQGGKLVLGTSESHDVDLVRNGSPRLRLLSDGTINVLSARLTGVADPAGDFDADNRGSRNTAIAAALTNYSTTALMNAAIEAVSKAIRYFNGTPTATAQSMVPDIRGSILYGGLGYSLSSLRYKPGLAEATFTSPSPGIFRLWHAGIKPGTEYSSFWAKPYIISGPHNVVVQAPSTGYQEFRMYDEYGSLVHGSIDIIGWL
jgi:hypothetical protein